MFTIRTGSLKECRVLNAMRGLYGRKAIITNQLLIGSTRNRKDRYYGLERKNKKRVR